MLPPYPCAALSLTLIAISVVASGAGCQSQPESGAPAGATDSGDVPDNFRTDRLVAWCIVPFDAERRGPAERAEMVKRLGLERVAYDWRAEHIPQFEEEIRQYRKNGIEFFAFWGWHESLAPLIREYEIRPQIWSMLPESPGATQEEKVAAAAEAILPLVEATRELGLDLGLYNHGGWAGEPGTMVAVCEYLRAEHDADHVGIVYNFHHGHEHIVDFPTLLEAMRPYLLCLNLNGMNDGARPKILPIGDGRHEAAMIETVLRSGYDGPIGILDHRPELDAEESLQLNIEGLRDLLRSSGNR